MLYTDSIILHNISKVKLWTDWRVLQNERMEESRSQAEVMVDIKKTKDRRIIALREEFVQRSSAIQKKFCWQQKNLREKMEALRKKDVSAIEESKNCYIESLIKDHENALSDVQTYYKSISQNNANIMNSNRSELSQIEKKEQVNKKVRNLLVQHHKCQNGTWV